HHSGAWRRGTQPLYPDRVGASRRSAPAGSGPPCSSERAGEQISAAESLWSPPYFRSWRAYARPSQPTVRISALEDHHSQAEALDRMGNQEGEQISSLAVRISALGDHRGQRGALGRIPGFRSFLRPLRAVPWCWLKGPGGKSNARAVMLLPTARGRSRRRPPRRTAAFGEEQ